MSRVEREDVESRGCRESRVQYSRLEDFRGFDEGTRLSIVRGPWSRAGQERGWGMSRGRPHPGTTGATPRRRFTVKTISLP